MRERMVPKQKINPINWWLEGGKFFAMLMLMLV